ncbi:hypothetical protein F5879DRAFT_418586 [Lentinula edodes]|nr:hypothetical protein F5879DRAFT_418586 [Lentinula edodes]
MLTGFEIPIIAALTGKVVATFKFSRTSVLLDDTRNILNDERLTKLLTLLYELDPKLAFENNEFREEVEAMFNDLSLMKGGKYILIRHISARKAKSLAKEYKHMITKNTNDARIKQAQEKARMREQLGIAQTTIVDRGSRPHSRYNNRAAVANNTFQYIDQNPDIAVFAYPRGTPENPTVSCPVGSKPILPDGFKFGTLVYYYQPSHVAMISSDESSSVNRPKQRKTT